MPTKYVIYDNVIAVHQAIINNMGYTGLRWFAAWQSTTLGKLPFCQCAYLEQQHKTWQYSKKTGWRKKAIWWKATPSKGEEENRQEEWRLYARCFPVLSSTTTISMTQPGNNEGGGSSWYHHLWVDSISKEGGPGALLMAQNHQELKTNSTL